MLWTALQLFADPVAHRARIYMSFWAPVWETSRNMNILMVSMIIHHVYLYSHCWEVYNNIFSRWRRTRNPSHCRQNPFSWKFEDGDKISKVWNQCCSWDNHVTTYITFSYKIIWYRDEEQEVLCCKRYRLALTVISPTNATYTYIITTVFTEPISVYVNSAKLLQRLVCWWRRSNLWQGRHVVN